MEPTEQDPRITEHGRYRSIEYSGIASTVTIIQDTENDAAWIQSDSPVAVTR